MAPDEATDEERERYRLPPPRPADQVHSEVRGALDAAPEVDASTIEIEVDGDVVYLIGRARSVEERRAATAAAHTVDGVRHVYVRDLVVAR